MPYQVLDRPAGTSPIRATMGDQLFEAGRKASALAKKIAIGMMTGGAAMGAGAGAGSSVSSGAPDISFGSGSMTGGDILGSGEVETSGASSNSFKDSLKKILEKSSVPGQKTTNESTTDTQTQSNPFMDYSAKAPVNIKIPQFAGSSPAMGQLISNMLASRRF